MKSAQYIKGYERAKIDYKRKGYNHCLKIYNHYTENPVNEFETLEDHVKGYCDSFRDIATEKEHESYLRGFQKGTADCLCLGVDFMKEAFEDMEPWDKFAEGFVKGIEMFESNKELMENYESL